MIRDGQATTVKAHDLVQGDIIKLRVGDKVPSDVRLTWTSGDLRFDRAAMTGESEEVEGLADCTDKNFLETKNMALMGTLVTNGSGQGVVVSASHLRSVLPMISVRVAGLSNSRAMGSGVHTKLSFAFPQETRLIWLSADCHTL